MCDSSEIPEWLESATSLDAEIARMVSSRSEAATLQGQSAFTVAQSEDLKALLANHMALEWCVERWKVLGAPPAFSDFKASPFSGSRHISWVVPEILIDCGLLQGPGEDPVPSLDSRLAQARHVLHLGPTREIDIQHNLNLPAKGARDAL